MTEECKKERARRRFQSWRERRQEDGTYREKVNAWQRGFRDRTGYARDWELRKKYGITLEGWSAMVAAMDGQCEI